MADNTPNTPDPGTGALSLDDAVDILTRPLPPPRDTPRDLRDGTAPQPDDDPSDDDTVTDDRAPADDRQAPDEAADTDDEQPEETDETDDAEAPDEDTQRQTEPSYEVLIDGKKSSVPVSELVKGYQRQTVFTQRSQSLADERRAFEGERDAVGQERRQYGRLLHALQAQLTGTDSVEPDWASLQANDPVTYSVEWARWNQRQQKLQAIESEQRRLGQQFHEEQQGRLREFVGEQARLLLEKVPEYRDAEKRTKDRDGLRDFATSTYGYTADEIAQLIDHRAVLVLRDARAYRELQRRKPVVEKRVVDTNAPMARNRVAQAPQASRIKAAEQRLNRSGRLEDAVELEVQRARGNRRHGNGSSR